MIKIAHPTCGKCGGIKKILTGRTMTCPKCNDRFTFSYDIEFTEKKADYSHKKHPRGHPRGRHQGE